MEFPASFPRSKHFGLLTAEGRDLLMVTGIALLLALPYLAGISYSDEGYIVHIADRIASGEVLYRDISTGVTPGSFYLHALLFEVFGRSLLVGRIFMMVLFSAATGSIYSLCRGVSSRTMALSLSLSFAALTVFFWRIPNYSSEAIILILLAIGSTSKFLRTRRQVWLIWAGLGLGAAFLFKQNYGAFAALAVTAGLLSDGEPWGKRLRSVTTTAAVAASSVILIVLYFAANGALVELWNDAVMIPLRYSSTIYSQPYPSLFGELEPEVARNLWSYLPFQTLFLQFGNPNVSLLGLKLVTIRALFYLPPAFLFVALATWLRRWWAARRCGDETAASSKTHPGVTLSLGMLYLASSALLLLGAFPRSDAFHLVKVIILFFPLIAWIAGPRPGLWSRRIAVVTAMVLVPVSIASQIAHVWDRRPALRRTTFLNLDAGRIWTQASTADRIASRVREIQKLVPPGEPIFAAPAIPLYYFLADRANPTRHPLVLPGGLDEEAVIRALDSQSVRLALVEDYGLGPHSFSEVAPAVWEHVLRNFGPAEEIGWRGPPYLLLKGSSGLPSTGILLRESKGNTEDSAIDRIPFDPQERATVLDLVKGPLDDPPSDRIQGLLSRIEFKWRPASWTVLNLRPALQLISPSNWNKIMVSWEVPAGSDLLFEAACTLAPDRWANPDLPTEGQGGVAEIWIGPAEDGALPRRVWMDWLDPRHRPQDRDWRLVGIDLTSFVQTPRARVTLVARPAPTFNPSDARVVWSGIRLSRPQDREISGGLAPIFSAPVGEESAREIDLDDAAAEHIMTLTGEDLDLSLRAAEFFPENAGAHEMLGTLALSLGKDDLALQAFRRIVDLNGGGKPFNVRPGSRIILEKRLLPILDPLRNAAGVGKTHTDADLVVAGLLVELGIFDLKDAIRQFVIPYPTPSPEEVARFGLHLDGFESGTLAGWKHSSLPGVEGQNPRALSAAAGIQQ